MNSIDSKIPRRTPCGDHVHDCPQLAEMMDALREENARLKAEIGYSGSPPAGGSWVQRNNLLTRERDEARDALKICESTSAFRHEEIKRYQAKLARLEGLILDWEYDPHGTAGAVFEEARRIRAAAKGE